MSTEREKGGKLSFCKQFFLVSLILPAEIAWLMLKFQFIDFSDLCVHKGKLLLSEFFLFIFYFFFINF